jgi:hypothetical protein
VIKLFCVWSGWIVAARPRHDSRRGRRRYEI